MLDGRWLAFRNMNFTLKPTRILNVAYYIDIVRLVGIVGLSVCLAGGRQWTALTLAENGLPVYYYIVSKGWVLWNEEWLYMYERNYVAKILGNINVSRGLVMVQEAANQPPSRPDDVDSIDLIVILSLPRLWSCVVCRVMQDAIARVQTAGPGKIGDKGMF